MKNSASTFHTQDTRMHYVTHRSHKMKKHKFDVTCPDTLLVETALGAPVHEK
jgi:hypothetical protein